MKVIIRKAKISDTAKIKKIIDPYAGIGLMLFRPIYGIYGDIRDYFVAEKNKKIIGCCALHVLGKEYKPGHKSSVLAEFKSLAVLEKYTGKGIGTKLTEAAIEEAKGMEINKLFTLTTKDNVEFFKRFGFKEVRRSKLPQKIWQECISCPKFPKHCNEVAMISDI